MTEPPNLFDAEPEQPHKPVGSVTRALHFAEQARLGRLAARDALANVEAELSAVLANQRRVAAARDAEVTAATEGKVAANPSRTSARAARKIAPRTGNQRGRILAEIVERGGATDHELARRLSMLDSSVRPRRGELVTGGYVCDSGQVREHLGSQWTVWQATDAGHAWFRRNSGGRTRERPIARP